MKPCPTEARKIERLVYLLTYYAFFMTKNKPGNNKLERNALIK